MNNRNPNSQEARIVREAPTGISHVHGLIGGWSAVIGKTSDTDFVLYYKSNSHPANVAHIERTVEAWLRATERAEEIAS